MKKRNNANGKADKTSQANGKPFANGQKTHSLNGHSGHAHAHAHSGDDHDHDHDHGNVDAIIEVLKGGGTFFYIPNLHECSINVVLRRPW